MGQNPASYSRGLTLLIYRQNDIMKQIFWTLHLGPNTFGLEIFSCDKQLNKCLCHFACLLVPLFFLALQQSVTLAMCNTCNMQNVQFATQPEVIFI